jgi:hypothetical protein
MPDFTAFARLLFPFGISCRKSAWLLQPEQENSSICAPANRDMWPLQVCRGPCHSGGGQHADGCKFAGMQVAEYAAVLLVTNNGCCRLHETPLDAHGRDLTHDCCRSVVGRVAAVVGSTATAAVRSGTAALQDGGYVDTAKHLGSSGVAMAGTVAQAR